MLDIYRSLVIPLAIILAFNVSLFVLIKAKVLQRLKLTKNLVVVLLVVTLVPILCIVFTNERKMSSVIFNDVYNNLTSVGKTRAMFLNDRLEGVKYDVERVTQDYLVIKFLQQVSIEKKTRSDPNFNEMVKDVQGHVNRMLTSGEYEDIMLITAEGKIELTGTNHKHAEEVGLDVSGETYFKQGKENTCFTDLFYNKFAGGNLMYIVTPCRDQQGRFVGCVMLEMEMDRIYDVLTNREGLGESGETYLVNKEKLMVSESRFQKDSVLRVKVDTLGVNECLAGKSGVAIYPDYRNIPVIGSWHPVKYTNWVLLAEIDEKEAFEPLGTNRNNQIALVSTIVVIVVLIAIFSARATVKPVQELTSVAEYVGEGKLDRDVKIQSYDEIGFLITVFNEMIKNMRLMAKQAAIISSGDLTASVEAEGERAESFNSMLENLRVLIKRTQDSIARISSASMEILSTSGKCFYSCVSL